ncbi:MAG: cupin domain-containing protein [Clostridia bacterium]
MNKDVYFLADDQISQDVGGGITRKVIARGGTMMIVEITFAKGACPPPHAHEHEQVSYCTKGSLIFTVDGEKQLIGPGDSIYMPSNCMHGCEVLEDNTILLDVFTPQRQDFLDALPK